jgi:hypothetical protein
MAQSIPIKFENGKILQTHFGLMNRNTAARFLDITISQVDTLRKLGYLRPLGRPRLYRYDPVQCVAGMRRVARDFNRARRGRPVNISREALIWLMGNEADKFSFQGAESPDGYGHKVSEEL